MIRLSAALSILLVLPCWSDSSAVQLEKELKGKTVFIRGFFQDAKLDYSPQGDVIGSPKAGSWTVGRMQVKDVIVRQDRFELRGPRIVAVMDTRKGELVTVKPRKQTIRITVHASADTLSQQQLDSLIQKLFVTDPPPDVGIFPAYWREFLSGNVLKARDKGKDEKLTFKHAEDAASESPSEDRPMHTDSAAIPLLRDLKGIEPPRIIYQIDPEFTESARAAKFSGTTVVRLEINKSGAIQDVQIVRPIGFGLDDQAVRAVEQWRFSPAKRNGEPLEVLVNVEVNFKLY